jgi:ABC-2 type transport system ATP-binding protein
MVYAIECRALTKTWPCKPPVEAVRGIDLVVEQGICFGVLGPNGAGKTTTIEICEGLQTATSGEARVLGLSWNSQAAEIREQIGISLQETRLSEKMTVLETLRLFRCFYQTGSNPEDVLARVSLTEKQNARIKELSGGQKQRVAVATALVGNPRLLFLDEPTTGLDPKSRRELWKIISDFRDAGGTVLLTTHYMDEAERLCDRVAIFDHGRILAEDSPRNLIRNLGAEHVVDFAVSGEAAAALPDQFGADLPGVLSVRVESDHRCLSVRQPHTAIPALLSLINDRGLTLTSLSTRQATLEDVFVHFAGHKLQEDFHQDPAAHLDPVSAMSAGHTDRAKGQP